MCLYVHIYVCKRTHTQAHTLCGGEGVKEEMQRLDYRKQRRLWPEARLCHSLWFRANHFPSLDSQSSKWQNDLQTHPLPHENILAASDWLKKRVTLLVLPFSFLLPWLSEELGKCSLWVQMGTPFSLVCFSRPRTPGVGNCKEFTLSEEHLPWLLPASLKWAVSPGLVRSQGITHGGNWGEVRILPAMPTPYPALPLTSWCPLPAHFQNSWSQLPWGISLSLPDVKAQLAPAAQFFRLLSLSSRC